MGKKFMVTEGDDALDAEILSATAKTQPNTAEGPRKPQLKNNNIKV